MKRIATERKRAKVSIRELSRRSNLSVGYLARLENGEYRNPTPDTLRKLATGLNIDVEELYSLTGITDREQLPALEPYLKKKYGLKKKDIASFESLLSALTNNHAKNLSTKNP